MIGNTIDKTVEILQVLTDKLSGINDKAKENTLLSSDYEELNNKLNTLSAMFRAGTNESDIVTLLNLPRPISEYTNDHIGEIINIPYNDESGEILLNTGCIEFEVVGVNHHTSEEHQQTITLMTKNIIRPAAFDVMEPNNPDSDRATYGNDRWSKSNIRQWLNSSKAANEWFTAQHEYDEAPTKNKLYNDHNEIGDYANDPGFLTGFSPEILQHFTNITNTTALRDLDGGGSETTVDKVFLASYTEMYGIVNNGVVEGTHLSVRYPDDDSKIKDGAYSFSFYWMRSPAFNNEPGFVKMVNVDIDYWNCAADGVVGIVPLIVLH